jgi:hypothetical protein
VTLINILHPYNLVMLDVLPLQISIFPSCPPAIKPFSFQSMLKIFPAVDSRSSLKMLPEGFRMSHIRTLPSNDPLAKIC